MPEPNGFIPVNDLRRSVTATSAEIRVAVERVLASGWYVMGPEHDAFESEIASFVGVRHAIGVANGTDALVLGLIATGCEAGDEVVTVANAGGYASNAMAQIGCRVVYADVDSTTLMMTLETFKAVVGPQTRAVVVTHLFGNVVDVQAIIDFCLPRGITVVEDCAQAIGATIEEKRVGTFGRVGTLSFYPTKNLGAAGDGGAVVTDDDAVFHRLRALRQYGWTAKYQVTEPRGRNSRLDEIQAAILRVGLHHVDHLNSRRREIVARYAEAASGPRLRVVTGAGGPTVAHLAVLRSVDRPAARDRFEAAAVGTDVHYPMPDHRQPALPPPDRITSLFETESAANEIFTIPCFPDMREDEIDRVCRVIHEVSET